MLKKESTNEVENDLILRHFILAAFFLIEALLKVVNLIIPEPQEIGSKPFQDGFFISEDLITEKSNYLTDTRKIQLQKNSIFKIIMNLKCKVRL